MTINISKKKCFNCKKSKTAFKLECKYCKEMLCCNCIQPEIHNCSKIHNMKSEKISILKRRLDDEKCVGSKIQRI